MSTNKPKHNRKTIIIKREQERGYASSRKENALHQFDSGFTTHIKNFIDMEKTKLKSLDKKTAKKVVSAAESNLLTFLKSRAKIFCLRSQQTIHPFHASHVEKPIHKAEFFDKNKLYQEIAREQRHNKVKTLEYSPLFEVCLRETACSLQNRKSEMSEKIETCRKEGMYIPLSAQRRLKKMFF